MAFMEASLRFIIESSAQVSSCAARASVRARINDWHTPHYSQVKTSSQEV